MRSAWFLASGGQRSAALAQYETCRHVLEEELGIEPSVATVAPARGDRRRRRVTELGDRLLTTARRPDLEEIPRPAEPDAAPAAMPEVAAQCPTCPGHSPRWSAGETGAGPPARAARRPCLPAGDPGRPRRHRQDPAGGGDRRRPRGPPRRRDGVRVVRRHQPRTAGGGRRPGRRRHRPRPWGCRWRSPAIRWSCSPTTGPGRELLLVLDNLEQLRDAAGALAELLRRAPGAGAGHPEAAARAGRRVAGRGAWPTLAAGRGRRRGGRPRGGAAVRGAGLLAAARLPGR